jgi:protein SCO1/2
MFTPARQLPAGFRSTLACLLAVLAMALPARAQLLEKEVPADARGLDVEEKPGAMLPLDTPLIRSDGKQVMLGDYFRPTPSDPSFPAAKPTILALVYFSCPVTCSAVMDKLTASMSKLDFTVGDQYNTLLISFDPTETPKQALEQKQMHLLAYDRPETPAIRSGFEFFTTDAGSAKAIADATGFRYRRLQNGQYSHPVCIFVITPEGKVSRYFYGFDYPARDVKLALLEAGEGKVARSLGDRVLMFCYMYDPTKGRYTLQAMRVMQIGGVITMTVVFSMIGVLIGAERLRRRRKAANPDQPSGPEIVRVAAGATDQSQIPSATLIPRKLA